MTDEGLASYLCPDDVETGLRVVAKLSLEKRGAYERLADIYEEIRLWEAGVGPRPIGVILCGPKQIRRSGKR